MVHLCVAGMLLKKNCYKELSEETIRLDLINNTHTYCIGEMRQRRDQDTGRATMQGAKTEGRAGRCSCRSSLLFISVKETGILALPLIS
jgi:hypothetical protein